MDRMTRSPSGPSPGLLAVAPHRLMFFIGACNLLLAMAWWAAWLAAQRCPCLLQVPQAGIFVTFAGRTAVYKDGGSRPDRRIAGGAPLLLHTAAIVDGARALAAHGIAFGEPKIELAKLRAFKDKVVGKLTGGLAAMANMRKVTVVQGVIFVICVLAFRRGIIGELGNWLKKPL